MRREVRQQQVRAREMRLGASALGEGDSMGGFASIPTGGMEVKIFCNEPFSASGVPWAVEARRRFEADVLPLLSETVLMLTVVLVLREQESMLRIERASHLGYDPLHGAPPEPQQILLFSGDTSSTKGVGT